MQWHSRWAHIDKDRLAYSRGLVHIKLTRSAAMPSPSTQDISPVRKAHTYPHISEVQRDTNKHLQEQQMGELLIREIIRVHAEPASWGQGPSDETSIFKSPGWVKSVPVDVIAPGDMHALGGRHSQGREKENGDGRQQTTRLTKWQEGVFFDEIKGQKIASEHQWNYTQVTHCVLWCQIAAAGFWNKGLTERVGEWGKWTE